MSPKFSGSFTLLATRQCAQATRLQTTSMPFSGRVLLAAVLLLGSLASPCEAQWNWSRSGGSHNWTSGGSWSGSGRFPNSLTAVANINNNITSNQVIVVNASVSVGTILLGDSTASAGVFQNFTIQSSDGSQTLTLGSGGITSSNSSNTIDINTILGASTVIQHGTASGRLQVSGNVNLASFALTVSGAGSTSIAGSITGTGSLVKLGSSNLVLSGNNSYTGGTTVSAGSVTGTTTSLQGSIVNNASVIFAQNVAGIYSGAMSGSGSLVKTGSGNLTLSGTNSYSGGTTVSAGTLTGTTSSLQGSIVNNANVVFNQATNGTWSGSMSGTGALVKLGSGNVTLAGNHSYSGGTTVTAGTLTGTTNSLQGAITNNAVVVFNQTSAGTHLGAISGTGSVVKQGSGNLTLAGTNSYSGGTIVTDGKLIGDTNSIQGDVTNNSTTEFRQSSNGTYAGQISGTGKLIKAGSGTVEFAGAQSFTGDTLITDGALRLGSAASLASPKIQIDSNATLDVSMVGSFFLSAGQSLCGSGQVVGDMTQSAGSTIAPGASPGTLTINGNLTLEGAATYQWEINDATGLAGDGNGWDLLVTTGSLAINATSSNPYIIQVLSLLPTNSPGDVINFDPSTTHDWEIIRAAGGITGFDSSAFAVNTTGFTNDLSAYPAHSFKIRQFGNSLYLRYVSVPEPSAVFVALLFGLGFGICRRPKCRQ